MINQSKPSPTSYHELSFDSARNDLLAIAAISILYSRRATFDIYENRRAISRTNRRRRQRRHPSFMVKDASIFFFSFVTPPSIFHLLSHLFPFMQNRQDSVHRNFVLAVREINLPVLNRDNGIVIQCSKER